MKLLSSKELKMIELEILKHIDFVCKENDIHYSISSGTLLGAIRHGGFIPWDDDIDIIMARDQYERFIQKFTNQKNDYVLLSCYNNESFFYPFLKLCDRRTALIEPTVNKIDNYGVYVDIFPIDAIPDKGIKAYLYFKMIDILKILISVRVANGSPCDLIKKTIWKIWKGIVDIVPINRYARILDTLCQIYNDKDTKYSTDIVWGARPPKKIPRLIFNQFKNIKFENLDVNCIENHDLYLKILYGDYMKLPKKEEQIRKHDFLAYWKI